MAALLQTIAVDGQAVAFIDFVFPSVASGSLINIKLSKSDASGNVPFLAADCTKNAGTATIDTVNLDKQSSFDLVDGASTKWSQTGFWSFLVTGSGSLTIRITMTAGTYCEGAGTEWSGTWDASRLVDAPVAITSVTDFSTLTAVSGPTVTTTGAAVVIGALGLDGNAAITITPTNGTQLAEQENGSSFLIGSAVYLLPGGAGTYTPTWNVDPGGGGNLVFGYNNITVAYQEVGAGSPPVGPKIQNQLKRSYRPRPFGPGRGR